MIGSGVTPVAPLYPIVIDKLISAQAQPTGTGGVSRGVKTNSQRAEIGEYKSWLFIAWFVLPSWWPVVR